MSVTIIPVNHFLHGTFKDKDVDVGKHVVSSALSEVVNKHQKYVPQHLTFSMLRLTRNATFIPHLSDFKRVGSLDHPLW